MSSEHGVKQHPQASQLLQGNIRNYTKVIVITSSGCFFGVKGMPQTAALGWCQLLAAALGVWVSRHLAAFTPGMQTQVQHLMWQECLDNSCLLFSGEKEWMQLNKRQ